MKRVRLSKEVIEDLERGNFVAALFYLFKRTCASSCFSCRGPGSPRCIANADCSRPSLTSLGESYSRMTNNFIWSSNLFVFADIAIYFCIRGANKDTPANIIKRIAIIIWQSTTQQEQTRVKCKKLRKVSARGFIFQLADTACFWSWLYVIFFDNIIDDFVSFYWLGKRPVDREPTSIAAQRIRETLYRWQRF